MNARIFEKRPMTRATTWLQAWDAQGMHRTATAGDNAGADWLAREAAALCATATLGATVAIETLPLRRIDPVACWIESAGDRIEGVPVFELAVNRP